MPSHVERVAEGLMSRAATAVHKQIAGNPYVEFISVVDNGIMSIGRKMDLLYELARGEFVAAVADDDVVADDYIHELMSAIDSHRTVDVISFDHDYYHDGVFKAVIKESIKFPYSNNRNTQVYTRSPSPKCAMRTSICKEFSHPDIWHGEDTAFMKWVLPRLKTEHRIEKVLYNYYYRGQNKRFRSRMKEAASG
jgi:hypothetical protein